MAVPCHLSLCMFHYQQILEKKSPNFFFFFGCVKLPNLLVIQTIMEALKKYVVVIIVN